MLTSKQIKKWAKEYGADLVGIGATERFEGAPLQMDPRQMFPDARSVIVLGFRVFRGLLRGIEEGTYFSAYSALGYAGINYIQQPQVLWNLSKRIEDAGFEALPLPNNFMGVNIDYGLHARGATASMRPERSSPVAPDRPAPDTFIHIRLAGVVAGLGEIGYSKMFLTPEFGPRQRLAAILTDAPLEPDPLFEGQLCDRCMGCVRACSSQAIPRDKTVRINIAGRDVEWADIDMSKCARGFAGGCSGSNPFTVTVEDKAEIQHAIYKKNPPLYFYARALEGASGCVRACMIHLEQQGKLGNRFHAPFRKRKPWSSIS